MLIKKKLIKIRLSQSDKRILICFYIKDFQPSNLTQDIYPVNLLDEFQLFSSFIQSTVPVASKC